MKYTFDAMKTKQQCILWIQDFFKKNGPDCKAVIGISGGKDSTVVAALCAEALGTDRVLGVLMPNGEQSDFDIALQVVQELGIQHVVVNIASMYQATKQAAEGSLQNHLSQQAIVNLPPRLRMTMLYAVSQTVNGRVSNNCNLSENWVGYSTRYGDSVGDFAPLANLTVTEVKAIGNALGLNPIFTNKAPSDGLCGKTDEDNLGFSYAELDLYIREGIAPETTRKTRIDELHSRNLFKLKPIPEFEPLP